MKSQQELKRQAAHAAVELIEPGMIVGLGSGSTSEFAIKRIGQLLADGDLHNIRGIPSSLYSAELAKGLGIPLTTLDEHPQIDLAIDGADEVDEHLDLIKGGGGAMLREKVVFQASKQQIVIVDQSKISTYLGEKWPVPIEVIPFAVRPAADYLRSIGGKPVLRHKKENVPYLTDQQNYVLDTDFSEIHDPASLASKIISHPGIVEHGIFVDLTSQVIIAKHDGIEIRHRR